MTQSLRRGASWGLLTVVVERGLSFALLLLVARVLEEERFGLYVYLLAGIMPIQVMADQGIEIAAVRIISNRRQEQAPTLAAVLALRGLLWVAVGLPVALLILPWLAGCPRGVAIAASLGILLGPSMPYRSLHRAREEMPRVWSIAVSDAGASLVAVAVALAVGGGVATVFGVRAVVAVCVTVLALRHSGIVPRMRRRWRPTLARLLETAWPLALNAALLTFIVRIGHLVAMPLVGARGVGELGAAARVAEMLSMLPEGVMMAAFPTMAARPRQVARISDDVARTLGLVVAWAVAVTVAGAVPIVTTLFGDGYEGAAGLLAILAWGALVSAAGAVVFYRLVVADQQRLLLRVNVAAALAGVALQIPLVWGFGIRGAAVATVLTLLAGQGLLATDPVGRRAVLAAWRRMLPAGLIALGAVGAARVLGGGWSALALAIVAFPIGAWVAGLIGPAERAALGRAWSEVRARVADTFDRR